MPDVRTRVTTSMIIIIVVSNCILHNVNDDATSLLSLLAVTTASTPSVAFPH